MPVPESPEERRRRSLARARKRRKMAASAQRSIKEQQKETEGQKLFSWRTDAFEKLGLSRAEARKWADSDVDYHELDRLLKQGCSLRTAKRILKSLD